MPIKNPKLAAVLACRNQSLRLYAKPLQYLDTENRITILDFIIRQLKQVRTIDAIVLAISEREENLVYQKIAVHHEIPFVLGDDDDVTGRLVKGAEAVGADHIFRITTESPYCHLAMLPETYRQHCADEIDFSFLSDLPDGAYFEIIKYGALRKSWDLGDKKHRSEFCSSYIFDHPDQFRISKQKPPENLRALDVRLTVDWPEDLIVMRKIYADLHLHPDRLVSIEEIITYLRSHEKINAINNWIDSGVGRIWY